MSTRFVLQVVSFAVIVAVGVVWMKSRTTAIDLQTRLTALTTARRNTAHNLEQERDRLRSALEETRRRPRSEAVAPASAHLQPQPPSTSPRSAVSLWAVGESRPSSEWRNEGQATPRDTVATLLWAAAGGDFGAMTSIIAFDDASRARAQTLFDALPPAARRAFSTPEALIAGLTIQAVPVGPAQLSWFHQRDDDHATVGVFLGAPAQTGPTEARMVPAQDNNPPTLIDPHVNKLTVLTLQRFSTGWRVVIPAAAVDLLSRQFKSPAS